MIKETMHRQLVQSQTRLLENLGFDAEYGRRAGRHPWHARLLEWLSPATHKHVLELGCGPGKYVGLLANTGFDVTGVDPLEFPTWARLKEKPNVRLMSGVYGESLPFPDGSFDAVVCLSALLYFKDPAQGLREMRRVLRPGGKLVVRTVNRRNFYTSFTGKRLDPASNNLFSPEELQQLVESQGFRVLERFTYGFWPPVLTDLWWYFECVWVPRWLHGLISSLTPAGRRVNTTIVCEPD